MTTNKYNISNIICWQRCEKTGNFTSPWKHKLANTLDNYLELSNHLNQKFYYYVYVYVEYIYIYVYIYPHTHTLNCSVEFDSSRLHRLTHQAPLSMGVFKQEYWSGLSFPPPGECVCVLYTHLQAGHVQNVHRSFIPNH